MGMFDSLYVKCPNCKKELEFKSKSGECLLTVYNKSNISPMVAIGMDYDIVRCQFCNKRIQLICEIPPRAKFKLVIKKGRRFDYEGNHNEKHPSSIKRAKELNKILSQN